MTQGFWQLRGERALHFAGDTANLVEATEKAAARLWEPGINDEMFRGDQVLPFVSERVCLSVKLARARTKVEGGGELELVLSYDNRQIL